MAEFPPLNSLRTFLYAAEHMSFKIAAERLFVTQSAVSHQIRLLEEHLHQPLFIRGTRELSLTPAGERLLPHIRNAFHRLKQGLAELTAEESTPLLSLSVIPSFATRWLVPRLGHFYQSHHQIQLKIDASLVLAEFNHSDIDIGLRFGQGHYPGLMSKFLMRDSFFAVCARDYPIDTLPTQLVKTAHTLIEDVGTGGQTWDQWHHEQGLPSAEHRRLRFTDASLLIDAVLAQQGIGLVRKSLALDLIHTGQLMQCHPYEMAASYAYFLVAPPSHFQWPKVQVFMQWLKDALVTSFYNDTLVYHGA